ncbi:MAG: flagellar transcriptional regulator FlhD [Betaproteobacteria bacterium]|jgi:flagellar transcriptional activator FlhD
MNKEKLFDEIRDANLNYLLLAQALIREDQDAAVYRLGISEDLAELLSALSPAQLIKIASSTTLLCRLRYDDRLILDMLVSHTKDKPMARTHAAILGASRPVEVLA